MVFKELINTLKKVKTEDDITPEVIELLTNMTIAANMTFNAKTHDQIDTDKQLFNITRMVILNHLDNYLLGMQDDIDFDQL